MELKLAQKIISELAKFSKKKIALIDQYGEVLAKTDNFTLDHNPLSIKSKKVVPVDFGEKKGGFLFIDEDQKTVNEIGKVLRSMAELIIHQAYFTEILTSDEKRVDQTVYDYFNTKKISDEEFLRTLSSFGINFEKSKLVLVFEITNPDYFFFDAKEVIEDEREKKIARTKRSIRNTLDSFYTHYKDNLICYLGKNTFVIFKDMGDVPEKYQEEFKKTLTSFYHSLKDELRSDLTIGVGSYNEGLAGIKEGFAEAQMAIRYGIRVWGEGKVFHFDNFGVVAPFFSGVTNENIVFSKKIIETLRKHTGLLETLECYFESDLSLSKTAKKLKIHRNTLVYRLERIGIITNLDPRIFNDAFQLQLALIMEKYSGE